MDNNVAQRPVVALFTYNRPRKTEDVLTALRAQQPSRLYIFCDGPRNRADVPLVRKNLEIVKSYSHPHKEIVAAHRNKGLARSLFEGISSVLEIEDSLVVLEDDCLPLAGMLRFMSQSLTYWAPFSEIFSISAHHSITQPLPQDYPYDVFLCPRFLCWGWGTWKDRWQCVPRNLLSKANPFGTAHQVPKSAGADLPFLARQWEKNMVDSWAIPLALFTLANNFLHVNPVVPLVHNIGLDGSGTHCSANAEATCNAEEKFSDLQTQFFAKTDYMMCPTTYFDERIRDAFLRSMGEAPLEVEPGLVKRGLVAFKTRMKSILQKFRATR